MKMKLAHISEDGKRGQTILDHSQGTAELASCFASVFSGSEYAYNAGMLHDIGKYAEQFQRRLHGSSEKYEHAAAGAQLLYNSKSISGYLLSYCVAGHHTGLPDGGYETDSSDGATLCAKLSRQEKSAADISEGINEIESARYLTPLRFPFRCADEYSVAFFIRMIFSCLTDADYLDTERFMNDGQKIRISGESLPELASRLENHMKKFDNATDSINSLRMDIYRSCVAAAESPPGIFRLCVPTGGGKTLSSVAFALKHAIKNKKRRIIYCIPYISIIRQTAGIFEEIFGTDNVLAHYSTADYIETEDTPSALRLASENWDKPVIITTNVQFFESLYSNRTSRCRKLHNIAESIVIFDEAQMIPNEYLLPCLRAILELTEHYGVSAVLCTATQPAFETLIGRQIKDIYPDYARLFSLLKRVTYRNIGYRTNDEMAALIKAEKSCLCVVNTKDTAREYFALLSGGGGEFHLSTYMCQAHIADKLDEIRRRLAGNLPCRVVSTSLIEAGVDVDFPCVFREYAALDSIIQAGGRCNREGKRKAEESFVTLFTSENRCKRISPLLNNAITVTENIEEKFTDISAPEAINEYFTKLYENEKRNTGLDSKGILETFKKRKMSLPFATVADEFRLIDTVTEPLLIPYNQEAAGIGKELIDGKSDRFLLRRAGPYIVQLYCDKRDLLTGIGAARLTESGVAVLVDMKYYSSDTGVIFPAGGSAVIV